MTHFQATNGCIADGRSVERHASMHRGDSSERLSLDGQQLLIEVVWDIRSQYRRFETSYCLYLQGKAV